MDYNLMLDWLAIAILWLIWIFGGAALFHSGRARYANVVLGWSLLNFMALAMAGITYAGIWAASRLLG